MKRCYSNASTTDWMMVQAVETIGKTGPVLLTEAECDHVAAAGGKKGVSPGSTV